jgi:NAD-dependent DNA ligase
LEEHRELRCAHPFNELVPVVHRALADGVLSADEKEDLLWLCERLRSTSYFDVATADVQRLHAILGGIAADRVIAEAELRGLASWLAAHEHLRTCWPYDEVDSLITGVLADQRIDPSEHDLLMSFFTEFVAICDDRTITNPQVASDSTVGGLCAVSPEIHFGGSTFCFTGASHKFTRSEFGKIVAELGGRVVPSVIKDLDYLVIGADGNPCWAYACYGRKVEKAVLLRKDGAHLMLVHENDFHDAVADAA